MLKILNELNLNEANNTVLRKLCTKLTQRIGLTFMKARVAAWRYARFVLIAECTNLSFSGTLVIISVLSDLLVHVVTVVCCENPYFANWHAWCFARYQRGSRSLADNLALSQPKENTAWQQADDEEEYDIPDEIEDVIGRCFS